MNVAGIDVGTNSVRLLITSELGHELEREMTITRLGQGVDACGALAPGATRRTLDVLQQFSELLNKHRVEHLRMTATSAARDASNREEFFLQVEALVGQRPELISGEEEAKLSFAGATTGRPRGEAPFVIFDIGGGSTEFAMGTDNPESFISVDMGGVRMTERFLKGDPPSPAELQNERGFVLSQLELVAQQLPCSAAMTWLGLAGTVTSCAAWAAGLSEYDAAITHGYELSPADVRGFFEAVASVPTAERRKRLVNPQRAEVIVGGALVLDAIVQRFGLTRLVVSEKDILDGLAASALMIAQNRP